MAGCLGRQVAPPPPPRAMGCNRNRPDINTTTVGGRGGGLGDCVYRLSLPRHGGPEGGGGGWEMDIRDPPWAQANFPPPLCNSGESESGTYLLFFSYPGNALPAVQSFVCWQVLKS